MVEKFHIGKNGPAVCKASKRGCRYGENNHFDSFQAAEKVFEKNNFVNNPVLTKKENVSKKPLEQKNVKSSVNKILKKDEIDKENKQIKENIIGLYDYPYLSDETVDTQYNVGVWKLKEGMIAAFGREPNREEMEKLNLSAKIFMNIDTLETRNRDSLDFSDQTDMSVNNALNDARRVSKGHTPASSYNTEYLKNLAGGRYQGYEISKTAVEPYIQEMEKVLGKEKAKEYMENKAKRDRGDVYHLTAVGPQEMKKMTDKQDIGYHLSGDYLTMRGLGKAVNDQGDETYFVVCDAPLTAWYRKKHGLPEKQFHITLGFSSKDLHDVDKGLDSLLD